MNCLFANGSKQLNQQGGLVNTNDFKLGMEDVINRQGQLDQKLEGMERARTYEDFQINKQFNNLNLNPHDAFLQHQIADSTRNDMIQYDVPKENMNVNVNMNMNNPYITTTSQGNAFSYNPIQMGMSTMMHPALIELNKQLSLENEGKNKVEETSKNENTTKNMYKEIIEVMESQDDERQKNSEFLKFIKKMHNDEIRLNEAENTVDVVKNSKTSPTDQDLDSLWNKISNNINAIEDNYNEVMKINSQVKDSLYLDEQNNPFLSIHDEDFVDLAKNYMDKDDNINARYALESEVKQNSDNSEAWLLLAKIHTENDRDDLAMKCCLKALEVDPFNVDAMLTLGISCTNEFDEFEGMINLANWIKMHHRYNKYYDRNNPLLDFERLKNEDETTRDDEDYYSRALRIEEMKKVFYTEMCSLLETIGNCEKAQDVDLFIAMGIANFIPQKYAKAIECFRKAVEINPKDHNAWNKLGAILAHSKMHNEAIETYKKAICIKPNYARCWANMGIAFLNICKLEDSMNAFLTALKIFPDIPHVWSYLGSVLIQSQRDDLYPLVSNRNLNELLQLFPLKPVI